MVRMDRSNSAVRFALAADGKTRNVLLAGDFSDWEPVRMRRRGRMFEATLPMPVGVYQYKFIVDGAWRLDPDNANQALSPLFTVNSVLIAV